MSKGCAFLMDMGTGKTITTIAVAGALNGKHKVKNLLVVSPKSIVTVWQQEFEKFADFPYQLAVLDGTGNKKADTIRYMVGTGLQVIVVNYESCWRLEDELMRWKPDMIVCDESSKIKNPQAKCSKALHKLGKVSEYNLILTGTPITNSPLDFFSQYKFLDETIFGSSFYAFRSKYAILGGFQNHQIVGYKNLQELVEKAHGIAYRIKLDEAVELPEFVEEMRPVELEKKAQQIYADPGISGTRAERRPDFLRMIEDCRQGKIQKVLVKSISRFARNTVDALNYIRELKDLNISVYFENENIDTLTPGGEVLLTILAAMAEQESRTMSTNIKWAYRKRFESGEVILNTGLMLGYTKVGKDEEGHAVYEINEEEAEIVRRIYREYTSGATLSRIAKRLEADGIQTKLGKQEWCVSVIRSILTNEKYTGCAILGKTFKPDVLTKYRQKNTGQAPMFYTEGTHPAIIDKELFELAKDEMQRRRDTKAEAVGNTRFSSKYPFSGLLICHSCGHKYRRHTRKVGEKKRVPAWACAYKVNNGKGSCESHHINETVIEQTYLAAIRRMVEDADEIIALVRESTQLAMEPENAAAIAATEQEIVEVQEAVLKLHKEKQAQIVSSAEYNRQMSQYKERMQTLESKMSELQTAGNRYSKVEKWLEVFAEHTKNSETVNEIDGIMVKALVDHIIIKDTSMEIHFKCGATIEQDYVK